MEIEVLTIQNAEGSSRFIHFVCATCGKERYGEITKKNAQALLSMMRDGVTVYPYCASCEAPEMPEDDSVSVSFQIYTMKEEMADMIARIQEEKEMFERNIQEALEEKNRLLDSLKKYKDEMTEQRRNVERIEDMVKHTNFLINDVEKTLKGSVSEIEKNMRKIERWHEKVVREEV